MINDLKACVYCQYFSFPFLLTLIAPSIYVILPRHCHVSPLSVQLICLRTLKGETSDCSAPWSGPASPLNGHYSQVTEPFLTNCASKPSMQSAQGTERSFTAAAADRDSQGLKDGLEGGEHITIQEGKDA